MFKIRILLSVVGEWSRGLLTTYPNRNVTISARKGYIQGGQIPNWIDLFSMLVLLFLMLSCIEYLSDRYIEQPLIGFRCRAGRVVPRFLTG